MRRKYGNVKVRHDGHVFDSRKEAKRYRELRLRQRAGEIDKLVVHPRFTLQPGFYHCTRGRRISPIMCTWDFGYLEDSRKVVEDVKSPVTRKETAYNIRKRLFLKMFPDIDFREVV